jgi:hypothetical protein
MELFLASNKRAEELKREFPVRKVAMNMADKEPRIVREAVVFSAPDDARLVETSVSAGGRI